jgi:hypothetical protein
MLSQTGSGVVQESVGCLLLEFFLSFHNPTRTTLAFLLSGTPIMWAIIASTNIVFTYFQGDKVPSRGGIKFEYTSDPIFGCHPDWELRASMQSLTLVGSNGFKLVRRGCSDKKTRGRRGSTNKLSQTRWTVADSSSWLKFYVRVCSWGLDLQFCSTGTVNKEI